MARRTRLVALVAPLALAGALGVLAPGLGGAAARPRCDTAVNLAHWSLTRLAAQTVAVPVEAANVGALAPEVRTGYGGILLFGTAAPASLGSTLATLERETPQGLGMLVMTDEEGGGVRRLDNLVAAFPWARTMAATMTPSRITALAVRVGTQLRAAGVTMDLAPVLDVDGRNVEPGAQDPDGYRSFGGATSTVITAGMAFVKGLQAAGEVPVVKHFPGLGGSTGNTDDGPAATLPWPVLKSSALRTFETAINRGAPAIMVANARVPGLTAQPASLSRVVMVQVLRQWLHFKGLIVTDSLTAGAISAVPLSVPAAAVQAIGSGADLVLLGTTPSTAGDASLAVSVANAIASAASRGVLARATLVDAAAHVLSAHGVDACTA